MKLFSRVVIAAVLMVGALSAGGVADAIGRGAHIVCINKKTGELRNTTKETCERSESKLISNKAGVAGTAGVAGVAGAAGTTGATGATGATGPAGINGINGTNLTGEITQLSICGSSGTSLCKIGTQGPGGGTIFFVDYNDLYAGFNYLEAAPVSCEGTSRVWSQFGVAVTAARGWEARAIGRGQVNTTAILAVNSNDAALYNAAKFADSSSCGSKDDWFLGSLGEMMLMHRNLQGFGSFLTDVYWSSSENGTNLAWRQDFGTGSQASASANGALGSIRPVRAF